MRKVALFVVVLGLFCPAGGTAFGDIINVPGDQPTVQAGIDAASNGDTVLVADGTWTGAGNKKLDFGGKAITVKSENGPSSCVIDCENSGRAFYLHNGETSDSVVDGFTIINGTGDYASGILCSPASPTITNCIVSDGYSGANWGGAGICAWGSGSSPSISNCTITGNYSRQNGGGVYVKSGSATIRNCVISDNEAQYGGGILIYDGLATTIITGCTISGNLAIGGIGPGSEGAGICVWDSPATIINCIISNNWADAGQVNGGGDPDWDGQGAGIAAWCYDLGCTLTVTNCVITGNLCKWGGGILSRGAPDAFGNWTITNCTIAENYAEYGSAVLCDAENSMTFKNCILWGDLYLYSSGSATVTYSDIQGGYPGEGNINANPLFVDSTNNDFHLQAGSPCIDKGTNSAPEILDTDFEGDPRITDGDHNGTATADMGADEFVLADNTLSGQDVVVEPEDCIGGTVGGTPITVTFDTVIEGGNTALCTGPHGPPPPSGFALGNPAVYYEINTTAIYSGAIEVCIDYSGISYANENNLKLKHKKESEPWQDVTSSLDTDNDIICGIVDSLSVFAILTSVTSGGGGAVGGTAKMANKIELMVPWIALITLVLLSTGIAVSRKFRKKSGK